MPLLFEIKVQFINMWTPDTFYYKYFRITNVRLELISYRAGRLAVLHQVKIHLWRGWLIVSRFVSYENCVPGVQLIVSVCRVVREHTTSSSHLLSIPATDALR